MSENSLKKFQDLLRNLFQFDCADLDFGIYRILNYKRGQVEAFITERLPQIVDRAFAQYAAADRAKLEQELEQKREEIRKTLGEQAIDESGQLRDFHRTKLGQQYLQLLEKRAQHQVAEQLKTRVYNDLYTFFSRYYEDGDFISKRRYGRHETYAIPYNGEEVMLYWANRDQYYIKTGDRFKAYRFKVDDYSVAFELRNVAPEQNGNAGKKRYFVLAHEAPVTWNEQEKALAIAFEYRLLTEAEEKEHGRTEQQKPQDSLNEAAEKEILGLVPDVSLKAALARPEGANGASLLHKHLTRFTRKNTADFFIHKDLGGFLRRELDFFLKNEVLLLDELIGGGEENLRQLVSLARVERQVAEAIIDFLAQIEDFQKRLWEKKKFVLRTEYCLTLDKILSIDEEAERNALLTAIAANDAQWKEWEELGFLAGTAGVSPGSAGVPPALSPALSPATAVSPAQDSLRDARMAFLCGRDDRVPDDRVPRLVVDTRHFPEDFKWRLLAHFDDLDEALDGLLIKSENWQALNLLLEKYREKVKCIYIDPPYNTGNDEFIYKDRYQHSSWLSMIQNRLRLAREWLAPAGLIFVSIDDNEQASLRPLMDNIIDSQNFVGSIAWWKRHGRNNNARLCSDVKDFVLWYRRSQHVTLIREPRTEASDMGYVNPDNDPRGPWTSISYVNPATKEERPNLVYGIVNPFTGEEVWHPTHAWKYSWEEHQRHVRENRLYWGLKGEYRYPRLKIFLAEVGGLVPKDVWTQEEAGTSDEASRLVGDLFGPSNAFTNPKPPKLIEKIARLSVNSEPIEGGIFLDFFAGSGTTAHAVINLNRQDGGRRQYILVEIGEWFQTVMLPRIKKVVFCEKWKDGKPQGGPGISHMLKYHYLEQYEDTLNNLELPREKDGQLAFEKFGDEYLLKYMLEFETQGSPSLLHLEMFKDPFAYRLKVQEGDEIVERRVDLVETFNYLLGIQVKKMRAFEDNGRLYRAVLGEKNGKRVAIVWRSVVGLEGNEEALMQDKAFIEKTVLPALLDHGKPDRLLVNGACFVKDAETIEPEFHRLMFAPVEA